MMWEWGMVRIHSGVSAAMHYRDNPGFEPFGMTGANPKRPITCGGMPAGMPSSSGVLRIRLSDQSGGRNNVEGKHG